MATATKRAPDLEFEKARQRFEAENREWIASDRHSPVPEWYEKFEEALDAMVEADAIAPYQFKAATAVLECYMAFNPLLTNGRPTAEVLRTWHELGKCVPFDARKTETPEELFALPGMSHDQIGKMLGIPISRVQRMSAELAKKQNGDKWDPEVFRLPEDHQTPEEREFQRRLIDDAKAWRAASQRWSLRSRTRSAPADDGWTAPPESIEELLSLPGMTDEQVARMHRVPVQTVTAIRRGQLPLPAGPDPTEEIDLHQDLDPLEVEREIRALRDAEPTLADAEIAERLGVPVSQVRSALKPAKGKK